MRIISKKHDYYDVVQKFGQDSDLLYVREPKVIEYNHSIGNANSLYSSINNKFSFAKKLIGFCGKFYWCFECMCYAGSVKQVSRICHTIKDVDEFVEENFSEKQYKDYYEGKGYYGKYKKYVINHSYSRGNHWCGSLSRPFFLGHWEEEAKAHKNVVSLFEKYYCPVFVLYSEGRKGLIELNCNLKDLEFYRIFDPYQAFQEISMFLGNMAKPDKKIPEVSNEDMIEAKGFDKKFSFRKLPKEKKK